MSEASIKGREYEKEIAKIISKKLDINIDRDSRSGAGSTNKADLNNYRSILPIPFSVEIKNQATAKPREWYKQARHAATPTEMPLVVFKDGANNLCLIELHDLLDIVKEVDDLREEVHDLREPIIGIDVSKSGKRPLSFLMCREGHVADDFGYCQIVKCKYSRGYRPSKVKR